jgi:ABC-2 type transport system permease protein
MLSMFNDKIAKVAKITYSEQIRILMGNLKNDGNYAQNIITIILNIILFGVLFSILYKNKDLHKR